MSTSATLVSDAIARRARRAQGRHPGEALGETGRTISRRQTKHRFPLPAISSRDLFLLEALFLSSSRLNSNPSLALWSWRCFPPQASLAVVFNRSSPSSLLVTLLFCSYLKRQSILCTHFSRRRSFLFLELSQPRLLLFTFWINMWIYYKKADRSGIHCCTWMNLMLFFIISFFLTL